MKLARCPNDPTPSLLAAPFRTVNLAPVTPAAYAENCVAEATACQSVIVQVPAPNDNFLARTRELRDGRPSLRARATRKAGSCHSRPSAFCRWPLLPYSLRPRPPNFWRTQTAISTDFDGQSQGIRTKSVRATCVSRMFIIAPPQPARWAACAKVSHKFSRGSLRGQLGEFEARARGEVQAEFSS